MQNSCKHPLRIIYICLFLSESTLHKEKRQRETNYQLPSLYFRDRILPQPIYHLQNVQLVPRYRSAKLERQSISRSSLTCIDHIAISIIYRCLSMIDPQTQNINRLWQISLLCISSISLYPVCWTSLRQNKALRVNSGNTR